MQKQIGHRRAEKKNVAEIHSEMAWHDGPGSDYFIHAPHRRNGSRGGNWPLRSGLTTPSR